MIVVPASLRSDFIHMAGMTIHIALESTIHIVGIRNRRNSGMPFCALVIVRDRSYKVISASP